MRSAVKALGFPAPGAHHLLLHQAVLNPAEIPFLPGGKGQKRRIFFRGLSRICLYVENFLGIPHPAGQHIPVKEAAGKLRLPLPEASQRGRKAGFHIQHPHLSRHAVVDFPVFQADHRVGGLLRQGNLLLLLQPVVQHQHLPGVPEVNGNLLIIDRNVLYTYRLVKGKLGLLQARFSQEGQVPCPVQKQGLALQQHKVLNLPFRPAQKHSAPGLFFHLAGLVAQGLGLGGFGWGFGGFSGIDRTACQQQGQKQ